MTVLPTTTATYYAWLPCHACYVHASLLQHIASPSNLPGRRGRDSALCEWAVKTTGASFFAWLVAVTWDIPVFLFRSTYHYHYIQFWWSEEHYAWWQWRQRWPCLFHVLRCSVLTILPLPTYLLPYSLLETGHEGRRSWATGCPHNSGKVWKIQWEEENACRRQEGGRNEIRKMCLVSPYSPDHSIWVLIYD